MGVYYPLVCQARGVWGHTLPLKIGSLRLIENKEKEERDGRRKQQ